MKMLTSIPENALEIPLPRRSDDADDDVGAGGAATRT
jgi:hypothetical protein